MKSVNEQFAEMQKKTLESLEPVKNMNMVAAEAFERIARKNYDLMGDLVDYAVSQVKTPTTAANIQEAYEQRVAETKAFAEKVNARAAEYVALAGELGEMAKAKAPAAPKAKTSSVADAAKTAPAKATAPAKSTTAPETAAPAKTASASAKAAPAKTASTPAKAAPAKAASATASKAATAPAKATAKTESKAAPAASKKKASAKKTAAKSK